MKSADFYHRVYEVVASIPSGRVTTYGVIARTLGAGRSARLVGQALNAAAGKEGLPCHRVVNRLGELTGAHAFDPPELMRELLQAEEVPFRPDGSVDLEQCLWHPDPDVAF